MHEAMLYEKADDGRVECHLCRHRCVIADGKLGTCRVRLNKDGTLYSLVYARAIAQNADPIEKKPLFHFQPGSDSFSIATVGCNFNCEFCQNHTISQMPRDYGEIAGEDFPPEDVVRMAQRYRCKSISYTYTEPTIFFEYAYDSAKLATEVGLKNVFVSNGFMTPEAIETIRPYLLGINVDLKAFNKDVYRKVIKGDLDGVLDSIRLLKEAGIWMEVTTLIVPTLNDDEEQLGQIAEFIAEVGVEIPWHVSRFHPQYRFTSVGPTPVGIIRKALDIGRATGLR
jgi:pyruvate formate lyase activating enzyme